jgi:hypothetical protein
MQQAHMMTPTPRATDLGQLREPPAYHETVTGSRLRTSRQRHHMGSLDQPIGPSFKASAALDSDYLIGHAVGHGNEFHISDNFAGSLAKAGGS